MKLLPYIVLLCLLSVSSCKEQSLEQVVPHTSLAALSDDPAFRFSIRSSPLGKVGSKGNAATASYLSVINDQATYLEEIITAGEPPFIDFSTHTLLAVALEYRGKVTLKPRKQGEKIILRITVEVPEMGPQGAGFGSFSVVVPKVDSANVLIEKTSIRVK